MNTKLYKKNKIILNVVKTPAKPPNPRLPSLNNINDLNDLPPPITININKPIKSINKSIKHTRINTQRCIPAHTPIHKPKNNTKKE